LFFGLDPIELIKTIGYIGLFAIVFAESGLLIGFFLPGDSLLFLAGFLASQGFFDITVLCIGFAIAAIVGDSVGYAFGHRYGRRLFERPDSRWFKRKHLLATEAFYEKHGPMTIVLARFLPIIRTFAPIVAGVAHMNYRRFLVYNVAGGLLWGVGVTLLGYWFGNLIPAEQVDKYLIPIILLIIVVSALPTLFHVWKEHRDDLLGLLPGRRRASAVAVEADKAEH
jgi:membrane-associated protein